MNQCSVRAPRAKWPSWELLGRRIKTQSANLFHACITFLLSRNGRPTGFASRIMEMEAGAGPSGPAARADGPRTISCMCAASLAGQKGYLEGWSNHTPSAPTRASTRGSKINPLLWYRLRRFCLLFVTRSTFAPANTSLAHFRANKSLVFVLLWLIVRQTCTQD